MRPYAEKLTELQNLSATLEGDAGEFTTTWSKEVLVVVVLLTEVWCVLILM
jgi:hypothetical protein